MASLLSDFLKALNVRHTSNFTDAKFDDMPFPTMFGLMVQLRDYGVEACGVTIDADKRSRALRELPLPCLVDTPGGFAIVNSVANGRVGYTSQQQAYELDEADFIAAWNGVALLARADSLSCEPDYGRHRIGELALQAKRLALFILVTGLAVYAMVAGGLAGRWSAWLLLALDCAGLWLSWSLVQKSLGIHTRAASAVCSALTPGGCDEIARSSAASFFGIFKWSEVGLAYFSVSVLSLLLFPSTLPALALINMLCLPYTIWSISYQKFVAKTWCTLCVCVQGVLWLLFAAYLSGGWISACWPPSVDFWLLGLIYITILLGFNRFDEALMKLIKPQ